MSPKKRAPKKSAKPAAKKATSGKPTATKKPAAKKVTKKPAASRSRSAKGPKKRSPASAAKGKRQSDKSATPKKATKKKPAARKKRAKARQPKATSRRGNTNTASVAAEIIAAERDSRIAALYLQHLGPSEIAHRLGMDAGTVRRRVRAIRQHWNRERLDTYDQVVNQFAATSAHIMGLAFRAYETSTEPDAEVIEREGQNISSDGGAGSFNTTETRKKKAGDPRFLELAGRMNYQIAQVHGVMDRDPRDNAANADQKSALIEVVVTTRDDVANLRQLSFDQLQKLAPTDSATIIEAGAVARH